MNNTLYILAFDSVHAAMATQKLLEGLNTFIIPTPDAIDAACDIALRMNETTARNARALLSAHPDITAHANWHLLTDDELEGVCGAANKVGVSDYQRKRNNPAEPARVQHDGIVPVEGGPDELDVLTSVPVALYRADGTMEQASNALQVEHTIEVFLDGQSLMSIVCTPNHFADLVIGRLYTEGIVSDVHQIEHISISEDATRADVRLTADQAELVRQGMASAPLFTTTNQKTDFVRPLQELEKVAPISWDPEWIFILAREFASDSPMHKKTFGAHSCYLAVRDQILFCCEDLGRHNALDKVIGQALQAGVDLTQAIIFSSGRLPVDMVLKGIRSKVPILVSKAVPTERTIELAREYDLTLICSARPDSMKVFNDPCA